MLHMLRGLCEHAGVHVAIRDERVQQLLTETDIRQLVVVLDRGLDAPTDTYASSRGQASASLPRAVSSSMSCRRTRRTTTRQEQRIDNAGRDRTRRHCAVTCPPRLQLSVAHRASCLWMTNSS